MNNTLPLQYALYRGLQSCSNFSKANIVLARDYIAQKIEVVRAPFVAAPAGTFGLGIVVMIPETRFPKPNSLQRERTFGFAVYEEPDSNWNPLTGTMTGADDWADLLIDFVWNWKLWRSSGIILEDHVVVPNDTYAKQGIIGLNVLAKIRQEQAQTQRANNTNAPQITVDAGLATISVTDGSAIWYTTDGFSYPSPSTRAPLLPGECAAIQYAGPFAAASGTLIMAASFANGSLPSQTATFLVP